MVGGHPIVVLEITKNEVGGPTELSDVLVVGWSVANSLAASPAITLTFFPPLAAPPMLGTHFWWPAKKVRDVSIFESARQHKWQIIITSTKRWR